MAYELPNDLTLFRGGEEVYYLFLGIFFHKIRTAIDFFQTFCLLMFMCLKRLWTIKA